jgi:hypothetical protein
MDNSDSKNIELTELLNKLCECNEIFTTLKNKYGDEFCKTLPLDKDILKYLNNTKKGKKQTEKTYGNGSNNHGTRWTNNEKTILEEMLNQNKSVREIGEYLGRTDYSIECKLISEEMIDAIITDGITYYVKRTGKKSWTIQEVKKLIKLFEEDVPIEDITKIISKFRDRKIVRKNELTNDDVLEKLEQLGYVEIDVVEEFMS